MLRSFSIITLRKVLLTPPVTVAQLTLCTKDPKDLRQVNSSHDSCVSKKVGHSCAPQSEILLKSGFLVLVTWAGV